MAWFVPQNKSRIMVLQKNVCWNGFWITCYFVGVLAGHSTFSILNAMVGGATLSSALEAAIAEGLCEPDPREDLNGGDVRRKVVVLARELGLTLEMSDVPWEDSLLPKAVANWTPKKGPDAPSVASQVVEQLKPYDEEFTARVKALCADGQKPVQLASVDVNTGTAKVELVALDKTSRVARCGCGTASWPSTMSTSERRPTWTDCWPGRTRRAQS